MSTGAKRLDARSTDARHWAECIVEEMSKRRFDEADFVGWFANYWAAIHDPLAAEIDRLQEKCRWTPVGERLPVDTNVVLVWYGWNTHHDAPDRAYFVTDRWFQDDDDGTPIPAGYVTHWMPLPEPPGNDD